MGKCRRKSQKVSTVARYLSQNDIGTMLDELRSQLPGLEKLMIIQVSDGEIEIQDSGFNNELEELGVLIAAQKILSEEGV